MHPGVGSLGWALRCQALGGAYHSRQLSAALLHVCLMALCWLCVRPALCACVKHTVFCLSYQRAPHSH